MSQIGGSADGFRGAPGKRGRAGRSKGRATQTLDRKGGGLLQPLCPWLAVAATFGSGPTRSPGHVTFEGAALFLAPEMSSRKASCRAGDGILESTGYHVPSGGYAARMFR